jgi:aryl-alcohol dehydrogenase-like predicted oxidoreductase
MSLNQYRTLGRSGLVLSPATLGTMTFGNKAWGSTDEVSRQVFDAYVDAGGNSIDTADVYGGGQSETLIGAYVKERKLRDQLVLATKFSFNSSPGNPHAGGNGRKNIYRALEGSLRRLQTDYIDLYWLHAYHSVTPVEEVLQTLGDLVRAGKIRYFGFSDLPAWYAVKAATLASVHHSPGPIAMQLEYSLVERSIEREHVPAALECGLGVMPWSPLAGGFLTGKYTPESVLQDSANRSGQGAKQPGRLNGANPFQGPYTKFTARNWNILKRLFEVASGMGCTPSQVALAWASTQPGISSLILGANTVAQLQDNIAALSLQLTQEQLQALSEASALDLAFPYGLMTAAGSRMIFGGCEVKGWR